MAVAWAVVAAMLALVVGAVIVWDLTGVRSHSGERPGRLRETLAIFRHRFVEAIPMASVKILVVIWQIVTQVRPQCLRGLPRSRCMLGEVYLFLKKFQRWLFDLLTDSLR